MSEHSAQIAKFPPLPKVPEAPVGPADERQRNTQRIVGNIAAQTPGVVGHVNDPRGFRASAVDVGRLQGLLEKGLGRFDEAQLIDRWEELRSWMSALVLEWVQRVKMLRIERRELGIRVELQTQDDLGYYDFAFDVFPKRA